MSSRNAIYAQSGGVTAVINTTASGLIQTCRQNSSSVRNVLAAKNGIVGILREELFDTSLELEADIEKLRTTPGGAFGSCRFKIKDASAKDPTIQRLFQVFDAHDVGYFFYNGGGDSQDTTRKISHFSKELGYNLQCIGIPKTVDNDLAETDTSPGFGSVAKYVAIAVREAALDVRSMCDTSTKVFILEVMGRHTGWIAAAGGLASSEGEGPPHIILFPEIPFDEHNFLEQVSTTINSQGYCVIVASEGIRDSSGQFLSDAGTVDSFGHVQLGGVAPTLATMVSEKLNLKHHYAIADYLQRSARHIASETDVEHAYAVGKAAVEAAIDGVNGAMVVIKRISNEPYRWSVDVTSLDGVANREETVPRNYITENGFGITEQARQYLLPLIQGESFPHYKQGLPEYVQLKNQLVSKRLPKFEP